MKPPNPKLPIIIPAIKPSLLGKYIHAICKGTM
jgi:hypothetical protein